MGHYPSFECASPFNDFRPTVQAAARAFLRTGLPAGSWDELSFGSAYLHPSARLTRMLI